MEELKRVAEACKGKTSAEAAAIINDSFLPYGMSHFLMLLLDMKRNGVTKVELEVFPRLRQLHLIATDEKEKSLELGVIGFMASGWLDAACINTIQAQNLIQSIFPAPGKPKPRRPLPLGSFAIVFNSKLLWEDAKLIIKPAKAGD